jgi:flagellar FliJ protein
VKRFRFRLDKVLRVRRIADRQARQALANAITERVRREADRDGLLEFVRERLVAMADLQQRGEIDPRAVMLQQTDLTALRRRVRIAEARIEDAASEEDRRMADLAETRRELEVVEKLREKALAKHRAEAQAEELASLDEFVARRHAVRACAVREEVR